MVFVQWWYVKRYLAHHQSYRLQYRYNELSAVIRKYRHLIALKRFGRVHVPEGVKSSKEGDMQLRCPACPDPGRNLPEDWETKPESEQYVCMQD
jgi:hypothetical protein